MTCGLGQLHPRIFPPTGMVIGPDGKPCKICNSFRNWRPPSSSKRTATKNGTGSSFSTATAIVTATAAAVSAHDGGARLARTHCSPDADSLGPATWTFLHTTAAYYPEWPSPALRAHMLQLLHARASDAISVRALRGGPLGAHAPTPTGRA